MKKIVALLLLAALLLTGCGEQKAENSDPTETTVDRALEEKFQGEVAFLTEYLENGTVDGEDASEMSPSVVLGASYYGFLEAADHPDAQTYLDRFVIVENVPLAQTYSCDNRVSTVYYAYDADGRLMSEPVVIDYFLRRLDYTYSVAEVYHGNAASAKKIGFYQDEYVNEYGETIYQGEVREYIDGRINYSYHSNGGLKLVSDGNKKIYYDEDGRLTQVVTEPDGWIRGTYVAPYQERIVTDYHYDENGFLTDAVEVTTHTSVNEDLEEYYFCYTFETVTTYTCDDQGRKVSAETVAYNGMNSKETWEYDEAGNLIFYTVASYNKDVWSRTMETAYTYDESGRILKEETWERYSDLEDASWISTLEYTYGDYFDYVE